MMTNEDPFVIRLDAKLASVERQGKRARVTFLVRDDDMLTAMIKSIGADCMLGVLVEDQPLTPRTN